MIEQSHSKLKKPNINAKGRRGPKTNKAKLQIEASPVEQRK